MSDYSDRVDADATRDLGLQVMAESLELKKTVLHLIGSFHQGGSERQAVQLARLMRESGRYGVHVACLDRSGVLLDEADRIGAGEIKEYPLTSFYDRNALKQLQHLSRFLREREIGVVQTHDFYTNVFGMAAAALARVPARIAARRETAGFRSDMQKRFERGAYHLSHAVVANADAVKEQLITEGVRAEKIVTIYNGLNVERCTPSLTREEVITRFNLPAESHRRFVTIVANLHHPVKDHPMFLRAAQRVHAAMPEAAFVVAGEGELGDSMRSLAAQLGIERDVFFIGRCEGVAELLSISDVCVLSSRAEGFSNSILEYMGAGCPVVATNVGGAREAIVEGETGYLVKPGDDQTMATRVASLLKDIDKARSMGERGRRRIEENFSCSAQLERTQNLYDRLLIRGRIALTQPIEGLRDEGG